MVKPSLKHKYVILSIGLIFLSSCGESGGVAGVFNTVTLIASATTTNLDSDVAKWKDEDGDGKICGTNDTYTVTPDDVDINIESKTRTNLPVNMEPSKVKIERVTITYTPATSSSPSISTGYQSIGIVIAPDSSSTVPVRVGSQELKSALSSIICSSTIYTYYVTLKFDGVEVNTNNKKSFETNLTVRFADF